MFEEGLLFRLSDVQALWKKGNSRFVMLPVTILSYMNIKMCNIHIMIFMIVGFVALE